MDRHEASDWTDLCSFRLWVHRSVDGLPTGFVGQRQGQVRLSSEYNCCSQEGCRGTIGRVKQRLAASVTDWRQPGAGCVCRSWTNRSRNHGGPCHTTSGIAAGPWRPQRSGIRPSRNSAVTQRLTFGYFCPPRGINLPNVGRVGYFQAGFGACMVLAASASRTRSDINAAATVRTIAPAKPQ